MPKLNVLNINGQNVGEFSSKEVTQDDLIGLMGGEKKEKKNIPLKKI